MINKLMKVVLLLLFVILSFTSAFMIANDQAAQQINKNINLSGYTQLYQPEKVLNEADYPAFVKVVEGVAQRTHTPFTFWTDYSGYTHDGQGNVNWFHPIETITFFQTNFMGINQKSALISGTTTSVEHQKLSSISYEQYQNADLFVQSSPDNQAVVDLANALNQQFALHLQPKDLTTMPSWYDNSLRSIDSGNGFLVFFIEITFVFYFLFLFVWLSENSQGIAVYRLNGMSGSKIAKRLFVRDFSLTAVITFILASLFILHGLSLLFLVEMAALIAVTLGITYVAILFVSRRSLANQINHKPFLKWGHGLLYLVKIYIFVASIATSMGMITLFNQSLSFVTTNIPLQNFGVLYSAGGFTGNSQNPSNLTNLFQYAQTHGAIHAAEFPAMFSGSLRNSINMQVNANYLEKVPIISDTGKVIHISNADTNGVILVNEKYKKDLPTIEKEMENNLKLDYSGFNASRLTFYLIKDNQHLPLYDVNDPLLVTDNQAGGVVPATVEIFTAKNASSDFLINVFNTGNYLGFLFPISKNTATTYKDIVPALKMDAMESSYISFVPASEMPRVEFLSLIGSPYEWIFANAFAFALFLLMIIATTAVYFRVYKKRIAVKRLQGASWWRTYRWLFALILGQYTIFFGYSLYKGNSWVILEIFAFYMILELVIVIGMLHRLERRSLLNVLKGE